ncbi:MAG: fibronectin type III domain-containing protein, partial [Patescibacteria group bacterium]
QVVIEPEGAVDPGTVIKVKLYAEENLSKAQVVVSGNVYNLTKNAQGYYETSFSSPIEFGEYKLNFTLTDDLGNESKFTAEKIIKVGTLDFTAKSKPGKVTGLIATPANGRVTLNWIALSSSLNSIKNYRVYYGLSPNQLTNAVDTFTAATTWYVPKLLNGTEYYFAVAAIDSKDNVSEGFEKIVSSVPFAGAADVVDVQPPDVKNGTQGADALNDMKKDTSETGPEILWLVLLSALGGIFYSIRAKKRNFV